MSLRLPDRCHFQTALPRSRQFEVNGFILVHLLDDDSAIKVLRNALMFHSGYFAELLEEEPQQSVLLVSGITSPLFEFVECWLRTDIFLPPGLRLSYADAVTIYAFADMYAMPRLRNTVIDFIFATIFEDQHFPVSALNDMYDRTTPGCSLRSLLVEIAIAVYNWEDLMLESQLIPKDFLLEVFAAIRGKTIRLGGPILFSVDVWHRTMMASLCTWHEHVEPAQYIRTCTGGEDVGAEQFDSGDCESESLEIDDTDNLSDKPGEADEPHDVGVSTPWHSVLVMRTR